MFRFEKAPQDHVSTYQREVYQLLAMIAPYVSDGDPEEWAESCFVSDMSSLGDFMSRDDEETPAHVEDLSQKLGFPVTRGEYIYEIAARMHGLQ